MIDGMLPLVVWFDRTPESGDIHGDIIDGNDQKGVKIENICQKAQKYNKRGGDM